MCVLLSKCDCQSLILVWQAGCIVRCVAGRGQLSASPPHSAAEPQEPGGEDNKMIHFPAMGPQSCCH